MKRTLLTAGTIIFAALLMSGCKVSTPADPLPSWNDTPVKQQILDFVENKTPLIPVEDRLAVFDLDGTVACEKPFGMGLAACILKMAEDAQANPELLENKAYEYSVRLTENPTDTSILNNWRKGDNVRRYIGNHAFGDNMENEEYVAYIGKALDEATAWNGGKYSGLFYQPMLELIDYLEDNEYDVYIVSGSDQGLLWGICPQVLGFDRQHLIGTRQEMNVSFPKDGPVSFKLQDGSYSPRNNYYGKSVNIYTHTGKIPVIAVGNTAGDFGMFHMATCNPLPHLALMINHDDAEREFVYPPYYSHHPVPEWKDSLETFGWLQADMSKEFKVVWRNNVQQIPFERLNAEEFMKVIEDTSVTVIDVRTAEEHEDGCIPGTDFLIDVLKDDFSNLCDKNIPASSTVAIYCRSGNRSQKAARILCSKGHKVYELESGYNGWKEYKHLP